MRCDRRAGRQAGELIVVGADRAKLISEREKAMLGLFHDPKPQKPSTLYRGRLGDPRQRPFFVFAGTISPGPNQ